MPSTLYYPHSGIRLDHASIFAHGSGADRNEATQIVVEGIHLGNFAGTEAIDVRDGHRRRGIEVRACGLDGDDEAGLLAEVGGHRHFVGVNDRDGNQTALAAVGERD